MELKEFVKKVILDLDLAVTEANSESGRDVRFKGVKEQRTALEFDVAVTVESRASGEGGGGIRVWGIGEIGAAGALEEKNSMVSRVRFGVDIGEYTKEERAKQDALIQAQFKNRQPPSYI